jgi:hypothetical protein
LKLSELTASAKRVALVGLAKNTGKTEALAALLAELQSTGRRVGVTSVGRDGEEHDVIDPRIAKPRVRLPAGSLLATTDTLLRASGIPYEQLEDPGVRTPLGRVLVARLDGAGAIEVAGPSAVADVRAVSDAMLAHGAEQVLIDGAIDRRAASSPDVADGLIVSTGAVLDRDIAEVVSRTRDAVELVRLPRIDDGPDAERRLRALGATAGGQSSASHDGHGSVLVGEDFLTVALPPRFVLTASAEQIGLMLDENPSAHWLIVAGALPEQFLRGLLHHVHRRRHQLVVVVANPTRVFLWKRGPGWYRRRGIQIQTLDRVELQALTINPVAPQSHRFDSVELKGLLEAAIPGVPILDVLHPQYMSAVTSAVSPGAA